MFLSLRPQTAHVSVAAWPVVRAEAMTEVEAELAAPTYPKLMGVAELAAACGTSRQRVSALAASGVACPPLAESRVRARLVSCHPHQVPSRSGIGGPAGRPGPRPWTDRAAPLRSAGPSRPAYAWRQAIFFLSLVDQPAQTEALHAFRDTSARQPGPWQRRFEPVLKGLEAIVNGLTFDATGKHATGLRFLGWSIGHTGCYHARTSSRTEASSGR